MRALVKPQTLAKLSTLAQEVNDEIDRVQRTRQVAALEQAPGRVSLRKLQDTIYSLQQALLTVQRPTLDEDERQEVLAKILGGLDSFGSEQAALYATREYTEEWFKAEPDAQLRSSLASALMERYGSSTFGSPEVWSQFI